MKTSPLAGLAAAVALGAHAQQISRFSAAPTLAFQPLDAIVVTATRSPQRTSDALRDVEVITREDIERAGPVSLAELLQRQALVEFRGTGGPGQPAGLFLRGANAGADAGAGRRPARELGHGRHHLHREHPARADRAHRDREGPALEPVRPRCDRRRRADLHARLGEAAPLRLGGLRQRLGHARSPRASPRSTARPPSRSPPADARSTRRAPPTTAPSATTPTATRTTTPSPTLQVSRAAQRQGEIARLRRLREPRARALRRLPRRVQGRFANDRNVQTLSGASMTSSMSYAPGWTSRITLGQGRDKLSIEGPSPRGSKRGRTRPPGCTSSPRRRASSSPGSRRCARRCSPTPRSRRRGATPTPRGRRSTNRGTASAWRPPPAATTTTSSARRNTGAVSLGSPWAGVGLLTATFGRGFRAADLLRPLRPLVRLLRAQPRPAPGAEPQPRAGAFAASPSRAGGGASPPSTTASRTSSPTSSRRCRTCAARASAASRPRSEGTPVGTHA